MINTIKSIHLEFLTFLLLYFSVIKADYLDIDPIPQNGTYFCWAACTDMILQYYENPPNLHNIEIRGTNGIDAVNGLCNSLPTTRETVQEILSFRNPVRNVNSTCHDGVELLNDLRSDFLSHKPVIAGLSDETAGHVVLIIGVDYNSDYISFNDPNVTTRRKLSYDDFTDNDFFLWVETLVPFVGSPAGMVPPEDASISISTGPSQLVYPVSNISYTSSFYCPDQVCEPPYYWNWRLKFYHSTGDYTVSFVNNLFGNGSSTWNVSAFTLPTSGYQWTYNESGLISGEVSLTTSEYSTFKPITYSHQVVIPGLLNFENQTISGSHSDVKAHYCIDINNVTINSGASITFKAGSCFTIDNLNVNFGSNANIEISPSLLE